MKKLFGCVLALFTALVVYADGNNISMVTYFPVPYVAYNRVQAAQQMDIGLTANGGQLSLGTPTSLTAPLTAGTTRVTGGMLNLTFNNAVTENNRYISLTQSSNPLSLGVGQDAANLNFTNLRIGTVSTSATDEVRPGSGISSINTDELVVDGLQLFGKDFPSCAAVNADSSGNGQIAWKKLALGTDSKQEIYLTCGATKTCPLPKPEDTDPCNVQEWVSSLSSIQLRSLYESGVVSPRLSHYCSFFNMVCDYSAMRTNLQNKEGTDYLLCGQQVRDYVCNLDANPPAWAPGDTWDRSACQPQKKQVKELISSCQNYFDNSGADISFLNGWTLEGNVYRIINHTKDADGSCSLANPVISTSECVAAKYEWGNEEVVSTGTNYVNFPANSAATWSRNLQTHPSDYVLSGNNSACYHISECSDGSITDTCSSGNVGGTTTYTKGVSTGSTASCNIKVNHYGTGSNGQRIVTGQSDLVGSPYHPSVYSCKTYRKTCAKRCRDVRLYEYDNGEKQATFVNSERNCD